MYNFTNVVLASAIEFRVDSFVVGFFQADFWGNTAHSGLIGLNVLGLPYECTAVGGFSTMFQWNYGVFSSTASSLLATHFRVAAGKVGINLNVFGPNPVAHLLRDKFIRITGEYA